MGILEQDVRQEIYKHQTSLPPALEAEKSKVSVRQGSGEAALCLPDSTLLAPLPESLKATSSPGRREGERTPAIRAFYKGISSHS